jgi:hypothetical protein
MNLEQLQHVVRAAARATGVADIVVIGSQAVFGSYPDARRLPTEATRSREADLAVDADIANAVPDHDPSLSADQIDGALGEHSQFDATFGYYAQGVEVSTAVLPPGWRSRLVAIPCSDEQGRTVATGWCLEVHDLWASKAAAGRSKDYEFCIALASAELVDETTCRHRVGTFDGVYAIRAGQVLTRCFGRRPAS